MRLLFGILLFPTLALAAVAGTFVAAPDPPGQKGALGFAVTDTFKIEGPGGWDPWNSSPATLDDEGKLLYVPRFHRTQAIDVTSGKVVAEIHGVDPRMVALVPEVGRGFITDTPFVYVFDLKTFAVLGKVHVADGVHGIIYDSFSKRLLVGCPGQIVPFPPDIDLQNGKPDTPIEIEGTPWALVADGKGMVYVTVSDRDLVAVVDTRDMRVATTWWHQGWQGPRGICMDRLRSRLFVGARSRVLILSATDGHKLGDLEVGTVNVWAGMGGVAFFDGRAFVTCGEGILSIIDQTPQGAFELHEKIAIPQGGWTLALNPKTGVLYLPAADPEADTGRKGGPGIKLVVMAKK